MSDDIDPTGMPFNGLVHHLLVARQAAGESSNRDAIGQCLGNAYSPAQVADLDECIRIAEGWCQEYLAEAAAASETPDVVRSGFYLTAIEEWMAKQEGVPQPSNSIYRPSHPSAGPFNFDEYDDTKLAQSLAAAYRETIHDPIVRLTRFRTEIDTALEAELSPEQVVELADEVVTAEERFQVGVRQTAQVTENEEHSLRIEFYGGAIRRYLRAHV